MSTPKRPTKQPAPQPPELAAIEQPAGQAAEQVTEQAAAQASDAAAEQPSAPGGLFPHSITVRCKRATGIWRGGRFWPAEQVTLPLDALTEEQVDRIVTEPLLDVVLDADDPAQ